jgi:uncharacterized protein
VNDHRSRNGPGGGVMATGGSAGSIAAMWRFPVKSMQGERLAQAELTKQGLLGDRAYAIVDRETGNVASAKSVRLFPGLLRLSAAFVEPPSMGGELPPVLITLPDGKRVTSDSGDADAVLSRWFHRDVTLARSAPARIRDRALPPDREHADPAGHRDISVEQELGAALFGEIGVHSPVPAGSFFDAFPLSVLTSSTLGRLAELRPESRFDERRFRMNVIVDTDGSQFLEDGWVGRLLLFGDRVRVRVTMPDPRCVMTTLAQEGLHDDLEVLRTLVRHNRIEVAGMGPVPCAGAYAVIESPGTLRAGDRMAVV